MEKEAIIYIRGTQFMMDPDTDEEDREKPIELVVPCTYTVEDGLEYIEYDEVFEGFENFPAKNRVEIREGSIEVHKTGAVEVDMVFEPGKRSLAYYNTPFGTLEMGISTMSVERKTDGENVTVRAEYALAMNNEHVADCLLDMRVEMKT